jgi:hypothetical protein
VCAILPVSSFLVARSDSIRWQVAKWATREVLSYRALPQRVAALRKLVNLAKVRIRVDDEGCKMCGGVSL